MPSDKKITDWRSLIDREPYQTIVDILDCLDKTLTLPQLLFFLRKPPTNLSQAVKTKIYYPDINKLRDAYIRIQCFDMSRQRLYEIMNILVENGLICKEKLGRSVSFCALTPDERLKLYFPDRADYFYEGKKIFNALPFNMSLNAFIEMMKKTPDPEKSFKEIGKNPPHVVAFIIQELEQAFRSGFNTKVELFGIQPEEFHFKLEVIWKGEKMCENAF